MGGWTCRQSGFRAGRILSQPSLEKRSKHKVNFGPIAAESAESAVGKATFNQAMINPVLQIPLASMKVAHLEKLEKDAAAQAAMGMTAAEFQQTLNAARGALAKAETDAHQFQQDYQSSICGAAAKARSH
jgi:hypothetical protein